MSEALTVGYKYRIYLINNFKYDGILLFKDNNFITIKDNLTSKERIIPIQSIMSVEVLQ
jgi:hypothetical protein